MQPTAQPAVPLPAQPHPPLPVASHPPDPSSGYTVELGVAAAKAAALNSRQPGSHSARETGHHHHTGHHHQTGHHSALDSEATGPLSSGTSAVALLKEAKEALADTREPLRVRSVRQLFGEAV